MAVYVTTCVFEIVKRLSRNQKRFEDLATYCADEGTPVSGSGKGWAVDCAKMAARPRLDSIEKLSTSRRLPESPSPNDLAVL